MAVVGGVAVSYEPAIGHTNDCGTLDVGDIDLEGVVEPDDFSAGEHIGIFDFSACRVWGDLAVGGFSAENLSLVAFDEVIGLAVEGILELRGFNG